MEKIYIIASKPLSYQLIQTITVNDSLYESDLTNIFITKIISLILEINMLNP